MKTQETRYVGTVWAGHLSGLKDIKTVAYTFDLFHLLSGQLPISFSASDTGLNISGDLGLRQAQDISFRINIASLPLPDPRMRGLAGLATARIESVNWDVAGKCEDISGTAQSNVLTQNRSLFNWTGPILSGPMSCGPDGAYVFSLSGKDEVQLIEAQIMISAEGTYTSDIGVITRDSNAALALPLFGFEEKNVTPSGRNFVLIEQGRWR